MRHRQRKCAIASKCTKTARQILTDITEQAVTPALVTYFKDVKIDFCCNLLLFIYVYAKLSLHTVKFTHNVCLRITATFAFPSGLFCFIITLYLCFLCFSSVFACDPISKCTEACAPFIYFSHFYEQSRTSCDASASDGDLKFAHANVTLFCITNYFSSY